MAVTPFKFPPLFRKPNNDEFSRDQGQASGSRLFKQFSPDTARYFKSRFELYIWKKNLAIK